MTEVPRSSFIPKEAPGMMPARVRRRHTFQVFDIVATGLLIGALLLAGAAFFMKFSAEKQKNAALEKIAEQGQFNDGAITEIQRFDLKLKAAERLLKNHISPLKIFSALESRTKNRVQFTQFTFEHIPEIDAFLTVTGATQEFKTLALQSVQFSSDPVLQTLLVTTLQAETEALNSEESNKNIVTFSMAGSIPQSAILYDPEFRATTIGNESSVSMPVDESVSNTVDTPEEQTTEVVEQNDENVTSQ